MSTVPSQTWRAEQVQPRHDPTLAGLEAVRRSLGDARLLDDVGDPLGARLSVDVAQARLSRILRGLGAALIAALALTGVGVGVARPAAAVAFPVVPQPVQVVISGPSTAVRVPVVSTARTTARGGHITTLAGPGVFLAATAGPSDAALLTLAGQVPSRGLRPGAQTWTLTDIGDGRRTPLAVTVRRQSRISYRAALPLGGGMVFVRAGAIHYNQASGAWMGSQQSPVQVQALVRGRWMVAATLTTSTAGHAAGIVRLTPGAQTVRIVRPTGATVTSATTAPFRVVVTQ